MAATQFTYDAYNMPVKELKQGITLGEISAHVGGTLLGDPQERVSGICPVSEPRSDCIAFTHQSKRADLLKLIKATDLKALLVTDSVELDASQAGTNVIKVANPMRAMVELIPFFFEARETSPGISDKADIDPTAQIGRNVTIGPFCSVGASACIGDDVVLHAQVQCIPEHKLAIEQFCTRVV